MKQKPLPRDIVPWPDPGDVEGWADEEIRFYFRESALYSTPAPQKLMLLSHSPAALRGWCRFWWSTFRHGAGERRLMEHVRYLVADHITCHF